MMSDQRKHAETSRGGAQTMIRRPLPSESIGCLLSAVRMLRGWLHALCSTRSISKWKHAGMLCKFCMEHRPGPELNCASNYGTH